MTELLADAKNREDGLSFRKAEESDRDFITEMFHETDTWGDPDREESEHYQDDLVRYVDMWSPDQGGIIAVDSGENVGAAWLRFFSADEPGSGFISSEIPEVAIALRPTATGHGLGRALLREALLLARDRGDSAVSLAVDFGNDRARHVYEKLGFTDHGIDRDEQCHVMIYKF